VTAQAFAFKMLRGNKEWVRLPGSRRARVGPLGLALLDFLRTDLKSPAARAGLWRRWRVVVYERPRYLSPRPIQAVPLEHLLEEQRWLRFLVSTWLLVPAPPALVASRRATYRQAVYQLGVPRLAPALRHGPRLRKWLQERGLSVNKSIFRVPVPLAQIPIAKRPSPINLPDTIAQLQKWRREHGDFFALLWWELDQAWHRRRPARRCQFCAALFIAAYGNERYCLAHRTSRAREQVRRRNRAAGLQAL